MNVAEIIQKINEILQKVRDGIDLLVDAVNLTLSFVPDALAWAVEEFRKGWDRLMSKLQEFWDWFVDKLSYVGNPFMLHGAAGGWREVGGLVSNQARAIDDSDLTVDDNWSGSGADQYRQSLGPQREAMTSVDDDFANNIAGALAQVGNAIAIFWGLVVTSVMTVVVGCAVATGEAISILGLPAVPPTVYTAVAAALAQLAGGTIQLYAQTAAARDTLGKTASGVQSWPAFVTA